MMRFLAILFIIVPFTLWAGETSGRITVTGEGVVLAAPDMATISLGVTHEAPSAREALSLVNAAVAAVLADLSAAGVDGKDMQTNGLSLNPIWDHRSNSNGPAKIRGYQASNTVSVRVRDLPNLGRVLDSVVSEGANQFHGLTFGLQQPRPLQDQAREAAVKDALAKARLFANAADVTLGQIVSISENGGSRPQPMMRMEAAVVMDSVPVAEGEVGLTMSVTMVFDIAD